MLGRKANSFKFTGVQIAYAAQIHNIGNVIPEFARWKKAMWSELRSSLRIIIGRNRVEYSHPTSDQIADFELEYAVEFPQSYCEFVAVLGPGEIAGVFQIAGPLKPPTNASYAAWLPDLNPDRSDASNIYNFCTTTDSDYVGWNLKGKNESEYPVVLQLKSGRFVELADDFRSFIKDVCLGGAFDDRLIESGIDVESPSKSENVFVPTQIPKK